jgi:hypothetical protein
MSYPKTLFRPGGPEIFYGRFYERCIVNDANEEAARLSQNWLPRPLEEPEPVAEAAPEPKAAKPKAKAKAKPSEKPAKKR